MKKISIVIPAYNAENYLVKALDSIPVREDIEVIVCDDCSTDNTWNIINEYTRIPLVKLRNNINLKVGLTRNKLLDACTGEYMFGLDSDDVILTDAFNKLMNNFNYTEDIITVCHSNNHGSISNTGGTCCSPFSYFLKLDYIKQHNIRFMDIWRAEDWFFMEEFNKHNPTKKILQDIIYHYNYPREGSLSDMHAHKVYINKVICAIAKHENEYINDWVNYHLNIGFDHIYIYDNNEESYEPIENRIDRLEKVTIFKVPGMKALQAPCYNEFYEKYKDTFDWCAYIDIDEFITLTKWNNINEFLLDERFKGHKCIRLNMTCIGDDGFIERDMSIPLYEGLKYRCNIDWLDFGGKQIIKGSLPNMTFGAHCPSQNGEILSDQITVSGKIGAFGNRINERNEEAYIRHYRTKTLSEFVKFKLGRTDACSSTWQTSMNYYFESNDKTKEKIEWLRARGINCE